jgi:hypothetical protein
MAKNDLSRARQSLARLRQELPDLLQIVLKDRPMLKAYLTSTPRTCGNPTCRCAKGDKHPAWVLRIPQGSTARSRSVPEAVYRRLEAPAAEYRRFREAVARWRRLVREADEALRVIEAGRLLDPETEVKRKP